MPKRTLDSRKPFMLERVASEPLAMHLGIHANQLPDVLRKFGVERRNGGFQIAEILRKVHRIEPVRLQSCLANLLEDQAQETEDGTSICTIGELVGIKDFATAIWEAGLFNVTDYATEYDLSYDHFRKQLKAGKVDLPPVAPIELSARKTMYRPLDVFLWHRYGVSIDWPAPADTASSQPVPAQAPTSDILFSAIMAGTIAEQVAAENGSNNRISAPQATIPGGPSR